MDSVYGFFVQHARVGPLLLQPRRVRRTPLRDDRPRLDGGAREWDGLALERAERGEGAARVHSQFAKLLQIG